MSHRAPWPPERERRFVEEWNAGLEGFALREKYGQRAYVIAERLRRKGYELVARRRGGSLAMSAWPREADASKYRWRRGKA